LLPALALQPQLPPVQPPSDARPTAQPPLPLEASPPPDPPAVSPQSREFAAEPQPPPSVPNLPAGRLQSQAPAAAAAQSFSSPELPASSPLPACSPPMRWQPGSHSASLLSPLLRLE